MPVLTPEKWSHTLPEVDGWYWAERRGGRLFLKGRGPLAILCETVKGWPTYLVPGEDDWFMPEQMALLFQAYCPIEPAPLCDVPLKT